MASDAGPPYPAGTTLEDERTGATWEVEAVERSYRVTIIQPGEGGDPPSTETSTYPEDVLRRKVARGQLAVDEQQPDTDTDGPYECRADDCGAVWDSYRALRSHEAQAHPDLEVA